MRELQSIDADDAHRNRTPRVVERHLATTSDKFEFLDEFKNPCYLATLESDYLATHYKGFPRLDLSNAEQLSRQNLNKYSSWRRISAEVSVVDAATANTNKRNLRCLPYYFVAGFSHSGGPVLQSALLQHGQVVATPRQDVNWLSHGRFAYFKRTSFIGYTNEFSAVAYKFADAFKRSPDGSTVKLVMGDASFKTLEQWEGHKLGLRYQNQTLNDDDELLSSNQDAFAYSTPVFIKSMLPESKIIVLLRDPVDRIKSIYKSERVSNHSAADFYAGVLNGMSWWETCILTHSSNMDVCMYAPVEDITYDAVDCNWHASSVDAVRTSIYHLYIREWLITFRRRQLLFIDYNYFKSQPMSIMKRVLRFLELRSAPKLSVNARDFEGKHNDVVANLSQGERALRSFFSRYNHRILPLVDDDISPWSSWLRH